MRPHILFLACPLLLVACAADVSPSDDTLGQRGKTDGFGSDGNTSHTLRLAAVVPKDSVYDKHLERIANGIENATDGRVRVQLLVGGVAGSEEHVVDKVQFGELSGYFGSVSALSYSVPELAVFEAPYLFETLDEAHAAIDGDAGDAAATALAEAGFDLGTWSEIGMDSWLSSGPIQATEDLADKLVWMPDAPAYGALADKLEMETVEGDSKSVITGFETGAVDTVSVPPYSLIALNWLTYATDFTLSNHTYRPAVLVFSKKWYDALPAEVQDAVRNVLQTPNLVENHRLSVNRQNEQAVKVIQQRGIAVHESTAQERVAFELATNSIAGELASDAGSLGVALLDAIEASISEN